MSDRLLYFDCRTMRNPSNLELPGMQKFSYFYKIYANGVMFLDRTGTIVSPVKMTSLFPMPKLRPLSKTYEEVCNDRARELLARADQKALTMYVFWSGGIDSTCVIVSLLKNATEDQKKNIVVVMSEDSINENPNFYRDHIHGKLRVEPGIMAAYMLLGGNYLIVNGEHNDQLLGSDMVAKLIRKYGESAIQKKYSRDLIFGLFNDMTKDDAMTHFYMDTFERLRDAAPMPITTNHDFLWWINFCLKFQLVHFFVWSYAGPRNLHLVNRAYLKDHYAPFYCTEEFQLWSMNNLDKRIKDTWSSYKWICKDVIYQYTKDADYRDNKLKVGSRVFMLMHQIPFKTIDDEFNFGRSPLLLPYHEPHNDFL